MSIGPGWCGRKVSSCGSDLTGVCGGEGARALINSSVRAEVCALLRVRVGGAANGSGSAGESCERWTRICSVCNARSSRVMPRLWSKTEMGEGGFGEPGGSAMSVQ